MGIWSEALAIGFPVKIVSYKRDPLLVNRPSEINIDFKLHEFNVQCFVFQSHGLLLTLIATECTGNLLCNSRFYYAC